MSRLPLIAAAAAVVVITSVMAQANQPSARPLDVLGHVLLAGCVLGLGLVRARPGAALAVCSGCAAIYFSLGYAYALWPAPALVALFTVLAAGRRAVGWAGAGFLVGVPAVAVLVDGTVENVAALFIWVLVVAVVTQLAEASRARRAYTAEVERRAAEAERTREEVARRRAGEERMKVMSELHDVTSHTVSVIALHAAVAAEAVEREGGPEEARAALAVIRRASREALAELKGILDILRAGDDPERAPAQGAGGLRRLASTAGLPVELTVLGAERPLPPAVDLTVYRVAQEALTNTLRHARATRARVTLRFETEGVEVHVDDDGRGRAGGGSAGGHGLAGMAARVAAVGGRLSVGDAPDGGFQVMAWLPTGPA